MRTGAAPACRPTARWCSPSTRRVPLAGPHAAHDGDGLLERVHRLARGEPWAAGGDDAVPEGAGAETEVDPPAAEEVEGRDRAGEDDGLRRGRFATLSATRSVVERAATTDTRVQASRWRDW